MNTADIDSELNEILKWNYCCHRVWEAWQYWTMKEDDFSPLEEDENFYNDIKSLFEKYSDIQLMWQASWWCKVTDWHPESLTSILIYDWNKTTIWYWDYWTTYRSIIDSNVKNITHWMELPTTMYLDNNF